MSWEQAEIEYARDQYLSQSRLGRYVIALFYKNEERLQKRARTQEPTNQERALAQALYAKYLGDAKLALANPGRQGLRLTEQHIADAESAYAAGKRFLREDELQAAERVADIARDRVRVGMTAREGLSILSDEGLLEEAKAIASVVKFLDTDVDV